MRPILEYSSAMWDPHSTTDVLYMEKIQRRAAQWMTCDYARTSSVTSMLNDLPYLAAENLKYSFFPKNGTVSLQILLNAIPYNSLKASSIYSTAVTHKNLLYYLIS